MKKLFYTMIMLLGSVVANAGTFSLSKTNFEVVAGGTVVIPIEWTIGSEEVSLYQSVYFTIDYSDAKFTSKSVAAAEERLVTGQAYDPAVSGKVISVVGKNPSAKFIGESGNIMYLTVQVDESVTAGTVCNVTITNGKAGDSDLKTYVQGSDLNATITVVDYVTIDENADFTPVEMTKDVHLIRSFEAGKFYTLVLPFAVAKAALAPAFGTAPTIYKLSGVSVDSDVISEITFNFGTSTLIAANTPYIIKINQNCENPVFAGAAIKAGGPKNVAVTEEEYIGNDVVFKGTYTPGTIIPAGGLYVKSDNAKLYASQGATKMKGTRAYIDISALGVTSVKAFTLNLDGEETGIESLDSDVQAQGWYDMNGRKLSVKPSTKGVYISNGKKVVVK